MYLFQFPMPFPTFVPIEESKPESPRGKRVTFAEDVKEGGEEKSSSGRAKKEKEDPGVLEGIIGQLDILASGAVRVRLGSDMVFDVGRLGTAPNLELTCVSIGVGSHSAIFSSAS